METEKLLLKKWKKSKLKGMWFKIKVPVPKNFSKVKDYRMFAQAFALLQVFKSTQNLKILSLFCITYT